MRTGSRQIYRTNHGDFDKDLTTNERGNGQELANRMIRGGNHGGLVG